MSLHIVSHPHVSIADARRPDGMLLGLRHEFVTLGDKMMYEVSFKMMYEVNMGKTAYCADSMITLSNHLTRLIQIRPVRKTIVYSRDGLVKLPLIG